MKTVCFTLILLSAVVSAWADMAIETMPGVTFYSGPNGGTMSVETMPGVRFFSGEYGGSAVEILPGITSYSLDRTDWIGDLERSVRADGQRRREAAEQERQFNERQRQKMEEFFDRFSRTR